MNVIYKITLKNLFQHKGRTLLGVFGIIIAIAAFTGVSILGASTKDMLIRQEEKMYLDWHIGIRNMSKEEQKQLEQLDGLTEIDYFKSYGYAVIPHAKTSMPYMYVEGLQDNELKELEVMLKSGRLPQNENEIVVSDAFLNSLQDPWRFGDMISLSIGQREETAEQKELVKEIDLENMEVYGDHYDNWLRNYEWAENPDWNSYFQNEKLKNTKKYSFTIVGVIREIGDSSYGYNPLGYDAFTKWESQNNNQWEQGISVRAKFKNKKAYFKTIERLEENENRQYDRLKDRVFYNKNLLTISYKNLLTDNFLLGNKQYHYFEHMDSYTELLQIVEGMKVGLYAVIMISTILFIYNIFAISLSERRKYLGIIASIGATERQKRSSMYFESFFMMILGLPLGILAGILGIQGVIHVIGEWVQDVFHVSVPFQMVFSWKALFAIVILTIVTIYSSAFLILKRSEKITPMEAIKKTKEYKIKRQPSRKGTIFRHFFGIEGMLAVKNGARNKGTKTILFSMTITLLLFIGISTYIAYAQENQSDIGKANFDIWIHNLNITEGNQALPKLREMESIEGVSQVITQNFWFEDMAESEDLISTLVSFDKEYEKEYWGQVTGENIEEIQWKEGEPIPAILVPINGGKIEGLDWNMYWKVGEQYPVQLESNTGKGYRHKTIELVGVSNIAPRGWYQRKNGVILQNVSARFGNAVVIPRDIADEITQTTKEGEHSEWYSDIYISSNGNIAKAKEEISSLSWNVIDREVEPITDIDYQQYHEKLQRIQLILYTGYITLVTIICILNILNLMNNKMEVRRREMAMFSSVGMTEQSISKMLFIESTLYSGKAILISIPLIVILQIVMYLKWNFYDINTTSGIIIPWLSMLFGCIGLIAISAVSFLYSYSKIKNHNIIEELKMD